MENLRKAVTRALSDYHMLAPGDRVLCAVSGGKDSTLMALLLEEIRQRAPFEFSLDCVLVDQKQPGFSADAYTAWLGERGLDLQILHEDTYSIVKERTKPGKSSCGLCSRLRRGILYTHSKEKGYSKIALGHHRDDANETVLMNLFFAGKLAGMPPKLRSDDGENQVIRPLIYCAEEELQQAAQELAVPTIPCSLCGSQNTQRQQMKALLDQLRETHPHLPQSMLRAQQNVRTSQLMDSALMDFHAL